MLPGSRIGVVLSSGGTRGVFAHTGFLLGLRDMGITYGAVAGCSAGAVVGGIIASGADLDRWARAINGVETGVFWNPDPMWRVLWRMTVGRGRGYLGLSSPGSAITFCQAHAAQRRIEDCPLTFRALALSLTSNRKVVFDRGPLAPCIVASAAMPVLYRPVEIDGDWYCDGAVVEFGPVDAICCAQNLDVLVLHHVARHRAGADVWREIRGAPWALGHMLDWIVYRQRPWYLGDEPLGFHQCPGGCGTAIVVVEPVLPELPWPMTRGGQAVQDSARRQAVSLLAPYRDALAAGRRDGLPGCAPADRTLRP